jgi:hypothetical protein
MGPDSGMPAMSFNSSTICLFRVSFVFVSSTDMIPEAASFSIVSAKLINFLLNARDGGYSIRWVACTHAKN